MKRSSLDPPVSKLVTHPIDAGGINFETLFMGLCNNFALALHTVYGYQIFQVWDKVRGENSDVFVHACCRSPSGYYVDALGPWPNEDSFKKVCTFCFSIHTFYGNLRLQGPIRPEWLREQLDESHPWPYDAKQQEYLEKFVRINDWLYGPTAKARSIPHVISRRRVK